VFARSLPVAPRFWRVTLLRRFERQLGSEKPRSTGALQNAARHFNISAERLPMVRAIYPEAVVEPELVLPDSVRARTWQRTDAIRELVRGRMEVCGPIAAGDLGGTLVLQRCEIDARCVRLKPKALFCAANFIRKR